MSIDLPFSPLGYGCASLFASRLMPEHQSLELIEQAIAGGIKYFDTGSSYGCGLAERRLGKALTTHTGENLLISTKAGTFCQRLGKKRKDFSAAAILSSLQQSLKRLQRDNVDVLYLHGPEANDINASVIDQLENIRASGMARAIGINSFNPEFVQLAAQKYPIFEVFMIEYNIYSQANLKLAQALKAKGKYVVAGAALGRSLYTNNRYHIYRPKNMWYWLRALKSDHAHTAQSPVDLNNSDYSAVQKALQFASAPSCIDSAVFNTTSLTHLRENIAAIK